MSANKCFKDCTVVLNDIAKAAANARSEVQKLLTVLEGPSIVNNVTQKNYNTLPYDVLDGTYFDKATLPEGPLTNIAVSNSVRSSDFFIWDAANAPSQNVVVAPSTIITTEQKVTGSYFVVVIAEYPVLSRVE